MGSGYRAEIDGLRAVAILPVVLYHFGVSGLSGGFVGVDVFFVISGFLIGGILWEELRDTGRLRLGRFFLRRIRRLAPAYYVMALATLVVGWIILLPYEFREFGKELISATVYLSNVFFYTRTGYFDELGEERILLHTWSLSVEEQFYLVLPLVLLLLIRWPRILPWVLGGLAILSFVACLIMTDLSQSAAFYLFPFRAWELLAGVMLAIVGREASLSWRVHPALSWAGLALILATMVLMEPGDSFPGLWAALPVLGTVLIIANGQDKNPVNQLLTTRGALFFGGISYSLYLWHWPIVTLARYYTDAPLDLKQSGALIALSVVLAWLSTRFIETPMRKGWLSWKILLSGYLVSSAATLAIAALIYLGDGLIMRFPPDVRTHVAASQDFIQDFQRCQTVAGEQAFGGVEICPIGPDGPPQVMIWGDSHARAFKEGLERAAFDADVPGVLVWRAGCPPVIGLDKDETAASSLENSACTRHNDRVLAGILAAPSIETVLLIGRWTYYIEGTGVGRDFHNKVSLSASPDGPLEAVEPDAPALLEAALETTIREVIGAGKIPAILRQVPEIPYYHSREAAKALAFGQTTPDEIEAGIASVTQDALTARTRNAYAMLQRLQAQTGVEVVDTWDTLCAEGVCSAMKDSQALYFDNNHITNRAAIALRTYFVPLFGGS